MRARTWIIAVLLITSLSAQQRSTDSSSPAVAPGTYRVPLPVKLHAGVAPGSETWTIPESTSGQPPSRIVRNVRQVHGTMMAGFDGRIPDEDIWNIVNDLRTVPPRK